MSATRNPATPEQRQAFTLLAGMTPEQRGEVLCWWCSTCRKSDGPFAASPEDCCICDVPTLSPVLAVTWRCPTCGTTGAVHADGTVDRIAVTVQVDAEGGT